MVEDTQQPTTSILGRGRKKKSKKPPSCKVMKTGPGMDRKKVKVSEHMRKLYRKRARDYNSDDDEEEEEEYEDAAESDGDDMKAEKDEVSDVSDDDADPIEGEDSDEEHEVRSGVMRFADGCNAFRVAFRNIMKKHVDDHSLGPVLSAHKKLVVAKLAEEVAEKKVKGEAKKEKHLIEEKGHVKPANFLDSHEKFLISLATKGVVKLFNAVNKAQNAQKGLNPSSFKDAKALTKRRKEAFMTELSKASGPSAERIGKASSKDEEDGAQPAWAPLRDTYMLTNSKLKDWDKMAMEDEKDI